MNSMRVHSIFYYSPFFFGLLFLNVDKSWLATQPFLFKNKLIHSEMQK